MKFVKDDIGLYWALTLVGAGIGLLVGSFISSRIKEKETPLVITEKDIVEDSKEVEKKTGLMSLKEKNEVFKVEEYKEFIERYTPSALQLQMLDRGLIAKDALIKLLEKQKDDTPPYLEKPELSDLNARDLRLMERTKKLEETFRERVELSEEEEEWDEFERDWYGLGRVEISDKFTISLEPPDKDPRRMRVFYFTEDDDTAYTMTRSKEPVPTDLRTVIDEVTIAFLKKRIEKDGIVPIYVDDVSTVKYYRFEMMPTYEEDYGDLDEDEDVGKY